MPDSTASKIREEIGEDVAIGARMMQAPSRVFCKDCGLDYRIHGSSDDDSVVEIFDPEDAGNW